MTEYHWYVLALDLNTELTKKQISKVTSIWMINSQVSQYANSSPTERKQHPTIAAKADVGFKGI